MATQPKRVDPYKNFKFVVKWNERAVAGVSKVSALKRTTEVIKHRDGADPSTSRKSPGRTEYEPITLERGVTLDKEFQQWANRSWKLGAGAGMEVMLGNFRANLLIEVRNEAGQTVLVYQLINCWVSEYQAMADLDANANAVLIESIKIEHEGWERDPDHEVPEEPSGAPIAP